MQVPCLENEGQTSRPLENEGRLPVLLPIRSPEALKQR